MSDELFPSLRFVVPCNCGAMTTSSREKTWPRSVQLTSSGPDGGIHRWGRGEECWKR